jgi:tetrahydromethanopterin S-methyltransferase subunit G
MKMGEIVLSDYMQIVSLLIVALGLSWKFSEKFSLITLKLEHLSEVVNSIQTDSIGKIERRLEKIEMKVERIPAIEVRLDALERRLDGMDNRLTVMEGRLTRMDGRLTRLEENGRGKEK